MKSETDLLVIGYGNTLRRDDGVGPHVAEAIAALALPGVEALVCPLLTPELAEAIARARRVVFVDAMVTAPPGTGVAPVLHELRSRGRKSTLFSERARPRAQQLPSHERSMASERRPLPGGSGAQVGRLPDVQLRKLLPAPISQVTAHAADPRALLALARDLFGHAPEAWWLTIPIADLGIGDGLSALAKRGAEIALQEIKKLAA